MEEEKSEVVFDSPVGNWQGIAAVFAVTLLAVKLVSLVMSRTRYNLPPGPWGLPLLGYLPFFGPAPHVTFHELRKRYGDVISIRMGSWPAIVINGYDVIKEALVTKKDDFAGRPAFTTARYLEDITSMTFLTYGPLWKTHRKIISNVIYTFSNARRNPIENIIRSDTKTVIEELLSHSPNQSFCPLESLDIAGYSMIYQLCFGGRENAREDQDFLTFLGHLREFFKFNSAGNTVNVMPWLRFIMPSRVSKFLEMVYNAEKSTDEKVEEHEAVFDVNNLKDITDGLIHAGNELTEEEKALGIDKRRLLGNISTIFGAGTTTVSSTLKWAVAMMVSHPDVQEEVFQQINNVVGQSRDITLADRGRLPLVEATVYEVWRFVGVLPFAIPHCTMRDTTLHGYDIPEGTVVMVNLWSICMDEELWGDPKAFRPRRFLNSEGQLDRVLLEQSAAFSLGRRRCVGESLARMEVFLFFATLMQRVQFMKPPGENEIPLKPIYTMTTDIEPFEVCVRQRE